LFALIQNWIVEADAMHDIQNASVLKRHRALAFRKSQSGSTQRVHTVVVLQVSSCPDVARHWFGDDDLDGTPRASGSGGGGGRGGGGGGGGGGSSASSTLPSASRGPGGLLEDAPPTPRKPNDSNRNPILH